MATLEIQGKTFEVDGDGFLTDPSIWNEDVAKLFAEADGITELNDKHWAIIKIIRDNFEENKYFLKKRIQEETEEDSALKAVAMMADAKVF